LSSASHGTTLASLNHDPPAFSIQVPAFGPRPAPANFLCLDANRRCVTSNPVVPGPLSTTTRLHCSRKKGPSCNGCTTNRSPSREACACPSRPCLCACLCARARAAKSLCLTWPPLAYVITAIPTLPTPTPSTTHCRSTRPFRLLPAAWP
ncbi:hypothetical protein COCCADRAFT_102333, partial [Bipolaris zeicola 26-R-13]